MLVKITYVEFKDNILIKNVVGMLIVLCQETVKVFPNKNWKRETG